MVALTTTSFLADIVGIKSAVMISAKMNGALPTPEDGLHALAQRPTGLANEIPWTKVMVTVPVDPWGNEYRVVIGDSYPQGFGILSCGPDAPSLTQGNDADDRNSWSEDSPRTIQRERTGHYPRRVGARWK